jgi:hypothetical protein
METEGRAIVFVISLAAIISYLIGSFVAVSRFQKDTYDCTIKCPDMAHSIQVNQVCYCEVR